MSSKDPVQSSYNRRMCTGHWSSTCETNVFKSWPQNIHSLKAASTYCSFVIANCWTCLTWFNLIRGTSFHQDCEQTCMSVSGPALFWGCSCCNSIWVHDLIFHTSCSSCFSVFPTVLPSHCGQWVETLPWFGSSTRCICSVFPTKCDEEIPTSIGSGCVEDLETRTDTNMKWHNSTTNVEQTGIPWITK